MTRHKVLSLVLVAACCTAPAVYAAPFGSIFHKDTSAAASSTKVAVVFDNTAEYPRQIKIGDKVKTLASKKATRIEIPAGTKVTVYSNEKSHNSGDVLIVVDAAHPDQTVKID